MASDALHGTPYVEFPPQVPLHQLMNEQPVPLVPPGLVDAASLFGDAPTKLAAAMVGELNAALAADDAEKLEGLFLAEQAYWKDALALTYHLRTFNGPGVVARSLLETKNLRGLGEGFKLEGAPVFIPATPVLQFIDVSLSFKTTSPAASGSGRLLLWPVKIDNVLQWKIWIMSTRLESLDVHPEDQALLSAPGKSVEGLETLETPVLIIGGGNAAVALAARLKALGIESFMAERNARPGDNWALRYDCLKFHIPTSFCDLPFMAYGEELQTPHLLTKDELAEQVRRYVATFNLNMINSATVQSTVYHAATKKWTVELQTPAGKLTVVSDHLVQATGIGSQERYVPKLEDEGAYKGISLHSTQYKNATLLKEQGAKSVYVVGSANTAFDITDDCHSAGLCTTMVVRSPTYLVPLEHVCDKLALGSYDVSLEASDRMVLTLPVRVDAQLGRNLFSFLASQEPNRYAALRERGFPVLDSTAPGQALMVNLIEKAGGHYVDTGSSDLIAEGKVGVKALVEPVAYTPTGLRFSDGSVVDTDAVVWCTGFADRDVRDTVSSILGGGSGSGSGSGNGKDVLGPRDIAERVDPTWGVDAEGEVRGVWKRQSRLDNYWVTGGYTQQHRWHSQTLALQIQAALEGVLPPAYRDTPVV